MIKIIFTLIFTLASIAIFSQNATVRGFVYNKENGEPVPFANVYLKGTTTGASSDLNGYFSVNKVKPGDYTLMVTSLEFDSISENISVKAGEILSKKFYATKGGVTTAEV